MIQAFPEIPIKSLEKSAIRNDDAIPLYGIADHSGRPI
jgi:hypothetical protein